MGRSRAEIAQPGQAAAASDVDRRGFARRVFPWAVRGLGLLVLVAMGFFGVNYGAALNALADANLAFVLPAFALFCGFVLFRMFGWVLLASSLELGYQRMWGYVRVFLIGWFVGLGLPRGAAPLARLAVVAADRRSVARGTVAVVADRLIQIGPILVLLAIGGLYLSAVSGRALRGMLFGVAVLILVSLALAFALRFLPLLRRRLASHSRAAAFVDELLAGVHELRRIPAPRVAGIVAVGFLAALLNVTALFLSSRALDIHMHYLALMGAWATVALVVLLPISVNGLGPREGILAAAVAGAGFDSESGVALGLLWFLMQAVTRVIAGAALFTGSGDARTEPAESVHGRAVPEEGSIARSHHNPAPGLPHNDAQSPDPAQQQIGDGAEDGGAILDIQG